MQELDKDNFDEKVINSKELCLVDYFGDTCEPCKALMPHVHELSKDYEGKVPFYSFNTSKARRLAIREKILGLPTIAIYKDGAKVKEVTKEEATIENIKAMVDSML
ncbi:thioredoxin family protein [uncultured Brachyspira sp.]|uniref:thioredoxin TrxA n=1 Tax=uncultured Brachyspira sp. TaxID=221953 RepID=UPI002607E4A3|nr:thioredoxin family protein [uncultured Brachyspira sp.]